MDDATLVTLVAGEYLRRFGRATQRHLREKADQALALKDNLSAEVWSDIAASAAELIRPRLDPAISSHISARTRGV
jgi:hypothetical protein